MGDIVDHNVECSAFQYSLKGSLFWTSVIVAARDLFKVKPVEKCQLDLLCSDQMTWDPFLMCLFEALCFVCRGIRNVPRNAFQLFMELYQMKEQDSDQIDDEKIFVLEFPETNINEELVHWSRFITHLYLTSDKLEIKIEDWIAFNRFSDLKLLYFHSHCDTFWEAMPSLVRPFRYGMDFGMMSLETLLLVDYKPVETDIFEHLKMFPKLKQVSIFMTSSRIDGIDEECTDLIETAAYDGFQLDDSLDIDSLFSFDSKKSLLSRRFKDNTPIEPYPSWSSDDEDDTNSYFYKRKKQKYSSSSLEEESLIKKFRKTKYDLQLTFRRKLIVSVTSTTGNTSQSDKKPIKRQCLQPKIKKAPKSISFIKPIKLLQ